VSDAVTIEISPHEQIRQLACRYAEAVDSRDLDALAECFIEDVQVGRDTFGRDALRDWFDAVLRTFGVSIHFIGNHRITVLDDDRAETERPGKTHGSFEKRDIPHG